MLCLCSLPKLPRSCLLLPAPFSAAACVRLPLCRLPSATGRGCSLLTAHRHLHGWAVWSVTYRSARPASAFSAPAACIPGTRTSHTRAARARISMVDIESFSGTCSVAQAGAHRSLYARQTPFLCAAPPAGHASLVCQRSNALRWRRVSSCWHQQHALVLLIASSESTDCRMFSCNMDSCLPTPCTAVQSPGPRVGSLDTSTCAQPAAPGLSASDASISPV